jgi:hypothetical protein
MAKIMPKNSLKFACMAGVGFPGSVSGGAVFARFFRTFLGPLVLLGALASVGLAQTIAFVQVNDAVPATKQASVPATYAGQQTAGNTNVVAIGWSDATSLVTSVTDSSGNSYVVAAGPTVQAGSATQVIYVARNIVAAAAGANVVTVTFNAAVPFADLRILEYSGLDTATPVDGAAGAFGTGTAAQSPSVTTTHAYDLIFGADYASTTTVNGGNGFVSRLITDPDGDIVEDEIVTTKGAYAASAQLNSGNWIMQTVALRGAAANPPGLDPSVVGQWGPVTNWPILSIHATLMPNGKVLAYGHDAPDSADETLGTIWDPNTNTFQPTTFAAANIFCSGQSLLPDGRVFVAGGHNMSDYNGIPNATFFNSATSTWSSGPNMSFGRWYPTVTALADGRMLVTSGAINCEGCNAVIPEVYDPQANSWTQLSNASLNLPIYPHMFLLPDGRVLNTGSYELPVATKALNVNTQTWTTIDSNVIDAGSAVMYLPGKILKSGTSANSAPPFKNSVADAYVIDMTQSSPAWRSINPMAFARTYHNMTVLPDGNVLVTGGEGTTDPFHQDSAANAAEMWSPVSENFTTMSSMQIARVYHSIALLLPDGRVLVGGSGEFGTGTIDQLNAEIYSPPYLFKGARPTVTSAPSALTYNTPFTVQTPNAATISSAALLKLGAVTHAFNQDQRYVPLTFTASAGSLNLQAPANSNLAPPGYYMLFLVNSNGVPSVASFVQVSGSSHPGAPTVASITPNSGPASGGTEVTITGTGFQSGASVKLGGTAATAVTVVSGTSITATAPAHAAGAVNVLVTNTDGQNGTLTNGFTYGAANPAPTVTSITPNSGVASGGTTVTIAGTGFLAGAAVSFGGTNATGATVVNSTSITATTPAHAAGAVNVVVTNTDQQVGTLANGFTYASTSNANLGLGPAPGDSNTATVTAGQTAAYTLTIGGQAMSGTAALTCTGAPLGSTCSIPPSQAFSSTAATTFSVKVTTTSRTMGALHFPASPVHWSWTLAFTMLGIVVLPGLRPSTHKRSARRFLRLAPLTLLLLLASCGGGSSTSGGGGTTPQPNPNGTPAGTYHLMVQAASNNAAQTTSLTLIVQ